MTKADIINEVAIATGMPKKEVGTVVAVSYTHLDVYKRQLLDKVFHLALFQKLDGSTEHAELFQSCHIDAVVIRISDLRGTGNHYNLLRMQTVEDAENTLLQGSTCLLYTSRCV